MKYIKRNLESLIAGLCFILIITYYLISEIQITFFLGLLGTIATLYFGSIKHKIENDKLFKELFTEFNSRYDYKLNDLINTLKYDNEKKIDKDERNLLIDYFNLCSEEFLWRRKNRIPKSVWESWKAGIKENLEVKQVKEIYLKEISSKDGKQSFYGLVQELEE